MKKLLAFSLIILGIIFSGCAGKQTLYGLKQNELHKFASKMYLPGDLTCAYITFVKGSVFGAKNLEGEPANINGRDFVFPKNSILLVNKYRKEYSYGFLVYPNGKFVYENYPIVVWNGLRQKWLISHNRCKYATDTPFKEYSK